MAKVLTGDLEYLGTEYILVLQENTKQKKWIIASKLHRDDIVRRAMGEETLHPELNSLLVKRIPEDYVLESVIQKKKASDVLIYTKGKFNILYYVLDSIMEGRTSGYKPSEILEDTTTVNSSGEFVKSCARNTNKFSFGYTEVDKKYETLAYQSQNLSFSLATRELIVSELEYVEASKDVVEQSVVFTVGDVTTELLKERFDLSWYYDKETGKVLKDYSMIETDDQVEKEVIAPLITYYKMCVMTGVPCYTSVDTETDGLNIFDLSETNPLKNHIVSMPISWKKDQGIMINFDMQHFGNVTKDYVIKRLEPLFGEDKIEFDYQYYQQKEDGSYEVVTSKVNRANIRTIAHNASFDTRVVYDAGGLFFFDEDTLQMAFNMNPSYGKGQKGLKALTKKVFKHDTLELSETLGKGNEDKFKYIKDKEAALLYACADTDYTLQLFHYLKSIMPADMYNSYQQCDPHISFILARLDYHGLNLDKELLEKNMRIIKADLDKLENFIYNYVGVKIEQKTLIENILLNYKKLYNTEMPKEELEKEYERRSSEVNSDAKYIFKMTSPKDLATVLYSTLNYPILVYTDKGDPAVNKTAVLKLEAFKSDHDSHELSADLMSDNGVTKLIKKADFNSLKYPIVLALKSFSALNKEFSTFYKPFETNNMENKLFKTTSSTNIETRRLSNAGQTIKYNLKEAVIPTRPGFKSGNFDFSQIEARLFESIAKDVRMIEKLTDPESDYHTENAALVHGLNPWEVPKKVRKQTKPFGFGIPYGLGEQKMCDDIFGKVTEDNLYKTRKLLALYIDAHTPTMELLDTYKVKACKEWFPSAELRKFLGFERDSAVYDTRDHFKELKNKSLIIPVARLREMYDELEKGKFVPKSTEEGIVSDFMRPLVGRHVKISRIVNAVGFHRLFDLSYAERSNGKLASLKRMAGNYPIQSFAAQLFRVALVNLDKRLKKEGLRDKFFFNMTVHDELQFSYHESIHPAFLCKILQEECCLHLPGHAPYYIGINLGNNWGECKDDSSELPVHFVEEFINMWDSGDFEGVTVTGNTKEYLKPFMKDYFKRRVHSTVRGIQSNVDSAPIDCKLLIDSFTNYTLRASMVAEFEQLRECKDDDSDDYKFFVAVASWAKAFYGDEKLIIDVQGSMFKIGDIEQEFVPKKEEFNKYADYLEEEGFSLGDDTTTFIDSIYQDDTYQEEDYYTKIDNRLSQGMTLEQAKALEVKEEMKNIKVYFNQIVIKVPRDVFTQPVLKYLKKFEDSNGKLVKIETPLKFKKGFKIKEDTDLTKLDDLIENKLKVMKV